MPDDAPQAGPELVFGLVGALGSDLAFLQNTLSDALSDVGYTPYEVRVSELIHEFPCWKDLPAQPLDEQIREHQRAGNDLRDKTQMGAAMAALAIGDIQRRRQQVSGDPTKQMPRTAYVIRSLKHPDEFALLSRVYGDSFFLLAAYAPHAQRELRLVSVSKAV